MLVSVASLELVTFVCLLSGAYFVFVVLFIVCSILFFYYFGLFRFGVVGLFALLFGGLAFLDFAGVLILVVLLILWSDLRG